MTAFAERVGTTEYSLPFRKIRSEYSAFRVIDRIDCTIIYWNFSPENIIGTSAPAAVCSSLSHKTFLNG